MGMRRFWRVTFSMFSHYPLFWTHPFILTPVDSFATDFPPNWSGRPRRRPTPQKAPEQTLTLAVTTHDEGDHDDGDVDDEDVEGACDDENDSYGQVSGRNTLEKQQHEHV